MQAQLAGGAHRPVAGSRKRKASGGVPGPAHGSPAPAAAVFQHPPSPPQAHGGAQKRRRLTPPSQGAGNRQQHQPALGLLPRSQRPQAFAAQQQQQQQQQYAFAPGQQPQQHRQPSKKNNKKKAGVHQQNQQQQQQQQALVAAHHGGAPTKEQRKRLRQQLVQPPSPAGSGSQRQQAPSPKQPRRCKGQVAVHGQKAQRQQQQQAQHQPARPQQQQRRKQVQSPSQQRHRNSPTASQASTKSVMSQIHCPRPLQRAELEALYGTSTVPNNSNGGGNGGGGGDGDGKDDRDGKQTTLCDKQTTLDDSHECRFAAARWFHLMSASVDTWRDKQEANPHRGQQRTDFVQKVYAAQMSTMAMMVAEAKVQQATQTWEAQKAAGPPGQHDAKPQEVLDAERCREQARLKAGMRIFFEANLEGETSEQYAAHVESLSPSTVEEAVPMLDCHALETDMIRPVFDSAVQFVLEKTGIVVLITGRGSHSPSGRAALRDLVEKIGKERELGVAEFTRNSGIRAAYTPDFWAEVQRLSKMEGRPLPPGFTPTLSKKQLRRISCQ
eukprot:TRINITY_DN861_c0_g1_i6.p1 TRINITY_DN861_c0_g1~~TRINITY_DN861_c0_g1_i6.p1  ORF type:complete len:553 (+),score=162.32 TRINITY_DN861_c0_g1_i6:181-1839(+)